MQSGRPLVSIIIVSYNTRALLERCLDSVERLSGHVSHELVVVDNGSVDGTLEMLRAKYPGVLVIATSENLGFGVANNLGARHARGEFLLLLNSDAAFLNDALTGFLEGYTALAGCNPGALGGWMTDEDGRPAHSAGQQPRIGRDMGRRLRLLRIPPHRKPGTRHASVGYVSGADLFVPRVLFIAAGGFDPSFFLYSEEVELQCRIQARGHASILVPGPRILHTGGASSPTTNSRRIEMTVGALTYYRVVRGEAAAIAFWLLILATELLFAARKAVRPHGRFRAAEDRVFLRRLLAAPRVVRARVRASRARPGT